MSSNMNDHDENFEVLAEKDVDHQIKAELIAEQPNKKKIIDWLKYVFERNTASKTTEVNKFRNWLWFQLERSDLLIFFQKYPRTQAVINIDQTSKINSLAQRHCHICRPMNQTQLAFPIFNFVLRIRGRSRQSISSFDFRAYQLAIKQHLKKNYAHFPKYENYCLALTFIQSTHRKDQDIDNMSKTIVDAFSRALEFNDAKITHLDAVKIRHRDAEECVFLKLGPSYLSLNSDEDVAIDELKLSFGVGPRL